MFFIAKSRWWWCETDERKEEEENTYSSLRSSFCRSRPTHPQLPKKGRKKERSEARVNICIIKKTGGRKKLGGERHHHISQKICYTTLEKKGAAICSRSSFFNSKRVGKSSSFSGIVFNVHTPSFLLFFRSPPKSVFYGKVGGGVDRTIVNSQMAAER